MINPSEVAAQIISEVITVGSEKSGSNDNWRLEPLNYHLDRAIRHIITHKLITEGNQTPDKEEHLRFALTRIAMALTLNLDAHSSQNP